MTGRKLPVLVRAAWLVLEHHRHRRCRACRDGGGCPAVEVARARIRAWRRYGS
ncbi:hypothetical protein [Micromonospora haikouensis]|uniref:hypothetical protein n=1 Tax=Micromonospora haikouensis TaxID=686309 RepID=UPI003D7075AA